MQKTELYFGLARANGQDVSDEAFSRFLDAVVTPRFPEGLTVLDGYGQWLSGSGRPVQERCKVLILLQENRNDLVEEVRDIYKKMFDQESVLRVDHYNITVSF